LFTILFKLRTFMWNKLKAILLPSLLILS